MSFYAQLNSKEFLLKKLILQLSPIFDFVFVVISVPAAYILLAYRKFGSARLPSTTKLLKAIGVFPIRDHYYEPMFQEKHLHKPLNEERDLPGLNLDLPKQIEFLKTLGFADELAQMNLNLISEDVTKFHFNNDTYESGDAEFLYQFIRKTKPSKIIEIGSGNSTKLARAALDKNKVSDNSVSEHLCIEPYEMPWLEKLNGTRVIRKKIEECDIDWSNELSAGDLLFIDSSHVIRPQSDVLIEYLQILPKLASGVYIHIHDIFTPRDYPASWVINDVRLWNEQYLLEGILANNSRYEIIAGLNYLKHNAFEDLKRVCPYMEPNREPGAIYLRVKN